LFAALEAAAPLARETAVHDVAARLHRQLGDGEAPSPDQGRAHCAAAELADRSRGWPSRVEERGLGHVDERARDVRVASILADLEGGEEQRSALVARLFRRGDASVRIAALQAAARVWHPSATNLVLGALEESDLGVVTAACEALSTVARR